MSRIQVIPNAARNVFNPDIIFSNVDTNAVGPLASFDMEKIDRLVFQVVAVSGAHTTHVVTFEISQNGTDWESSNASVTGLGYSGLDITVAGIKFGRFNVTTPEGASSVSDILAAGTKI